MPQQRKHESPAHRQAAYLERLKIARRSHLEERGLPALPVIPMIPGVKRWNAALCRAELLLSAVQAEMTSYFDDRSEVWQESDRGVEHSERLTAVEALVDAIAELR